MPDKPKHDFKFYIDGPPKLSPVDRIIDLHHGSTTAIEKTPQRLQASKQYPAPSLLETIEQLQKQNSNQKHELAYYREMEQHRVDFEILVTLQKEGLEKALAKLSSIQRKVDHGWFQLGNVNRADFQE